MDGGATLLLASLATTAIGTGISFYGQQEAAKSQQRVADYNYEIARQNAQIQSNAAKTQAQWNEASLNAQLQAQQNNATALEAQARAKEAEGREVANREREKNARILATQRAKYAKSGVTSAGSPLLVEAESAALLELGVQDVLVESNNEAKNFQYQADLSRWQTNFTQLDLAKNAYDLAAAEAGHGIDLYSAGVSRDAGYAQARGTSMGAYSSLISGFGQGLNSYAGYRDRKSALRI